MCDGGGGDSGGGDGGGGYSSGDGGGGYSSGDVGFDNNPGTTSDRYSSDHPYGGTNHYNTHQSGGFFSKVSPPVAIFFFLLPMIIGFGVGGYLLHDILVNMKTWVSTVGTVIDSISCGCTSSGTNTGCTTTYSPLIEYMVDGIAYQFKSSVCSSPKRSVGSSIKVFYDPDDPSDARDGSFTSMWLGPIVAFIFGIASAGMLVYIIRKKLLSRKEQQQQQQINMTFNGSDKINGSTYAHSGVGQYTTSSVSTSDPMVSNSELSVPEYSSSIPYAQTETKYDENKKPSLFDQLQANTK